MHCSPLSSAIGCSLPRSLLSRRGKYLLYRPRSPTRRPSATAEQRKCSSPHSASALPRTKPCCLHTALTTTYTHPATTSTSVVRPYPRAGPALPRRPQGTIPSCLADDDTARGCVLHVVAFCLLDRNSMTLHKDRGVCGTDPRDRNANSCGPASRRGCHARYVYVKGDDTGRRR